MTANQQLLPVRVEIRRPLMSVDAVRGVLDCSEDDVLALIEEGRLRAWDLRSPNAERAFVRVLAHCVETARNAPESLKDTRPHNLIFSALWKHSRPILMSTELCRVWNCGSDHIHDLAKSGALVATKAQRDRNEAAPLERQSVETFMETRQL